MIHTRLNVCSRDQHSERIPLRCSVDPISLAVGALGGLAGSMFGGGGGGTQVVAAPEKPKEQAQVVPPSQAPQGQKPMPKSQTPTFLGAAAAPMPNQTSGTKTLLGQ